MAGAAGDGAAGEGAAGAAHAAHAADADMDADMDADAGADTDADADGADADQWVECCLHHRWRLLPAGTTTADVDALPEEWTCVLLGDDCVAAAAAGTLRADEVLVN